MSNDSGPSCFQAYRPQQPHLLIPEELPYHSLIDRLTSHEEFQFYSPFILGLLTADEQHWQFFLFVRSKDCSPLFRQLCPGLYYYPPPKIADLIIGIRHNKRWYETRQAVLRRVADARRPSTTSGTTSHDSGHGQTQEIHLTPATASTRSRSGDRQGRDPLSHQHQRPGSGYQLFSRGPGSSCAAGSPTPTQGHSSNQGRTAPEHHLFYCPSKKCRRSYPRQGYTRQGHYENHMQMCHDEWPPHDPSTSLREKPSPEQLDGGNIIEDGGLQRSADSTWPISYQPVFVAPAPYNLHPSSPEPRSERPRTPQPDTVLSDIIESGTEPAVSGPGLDPFSATLPAYNGVYADFNFLERQQQLFYTPLSQTSSTFAPPLYSADEYMDGQC